MKKKSKLNKKKLKKYPKGTPNSIAQIRKKPVVIIRTTPIKI